MPQALIFGIALLQVARGAGNGAAGADADDQLCDGAVGLLPDLRAGLLVVRLRIGRVVVLVRLPRVRHFLDQPRRHRVVRPRVFRIHVGRADDDVGAEGAQRVDFLLRLLVGGGEDALVALDDRRHRQAHAGVARGALDDRPARFEQAGALGVLDHLHRHAVLDRVARIEGFDLREHRAFDEAPGDFVDANQRRVADGIEDGGADLLHAPSLY